MLTTQWQVISAKPISQRIEKMSIVRWKGESGKTGKYHIDAGLQLTQCGLNIPHQRKEWSVYGEAECRNCLKKYKTLNNGEDYNGGFC